MRAKDELKANGLAYEEIVVMAKGAIATNEQEIGREDLKLLFPGRTHLPIILCDGLMIGGFDNLQGYLKETMKRG